MENLDKLFQDKILEKKWLKRFIIIINKIKIQMILKNLNNHNRPNTYVQIKSKKKVLIKAKNLQKIKIKMMLLQLINKTSQKINQ